MQSTDIPTRVQEPFAANAVPGTVRTVPVASQIGLQDGAASYHDGFPPLTMQPISSGGVAPFGQDFNGLMLAVTQWTRWQCAGGTVAYDPTFAAAVGGYPAFALLASRLQLGLYWLNTVEGNTSDPDAGGAGWQSADFTGAANTGVIRFTVRVAAAPGWILINADPFTIGSAASGASYAAADALSVYSVLWGGISNSFAPVSGGRGASSAVDFASNKAIAFPSVLGRVLGVAGAGSGLTARALGQFLGEQSHTMLLSELVAHLHALSDPGHNHTIPFQTGNQTQAGGDSAKAQGGGTNTSTNTTGITVQNQGGGAPFNVMQPSTFFNLELKK